ncbi:M48 family metallopeptidase [Streptomyces guryensis]|uniref:M48 family metallopeptidase n=1 Tax=Streptomyces guryensis TaxID=2886947 RepID=A0A9Q3ZA73_9ACTN|nr:SprT family zinc-dependent metalloprotease [Streptomyces guryensis]MCD9880558.1 M48 family metallopeptidase [Streptomyces guryensis]
MPPSSSPLPSPGDPVAGNLSDGQLLHVGELQLHIRVSGRRTRLGLTVERDGSVILRTPPDCDEERARAFVRAHEDWIADKARLRDRFRPAHASVDLIDGTVFRYLGRDCRLLLVDADAEPVRLQAGRLRLDRAFASDQAAGRKALVDWYQQTGAAWSLGRLQPWAARMDVTEPRVEVRDLGLRWGAYIPDSGRGVSTGRMALHWAVFQLPIRLVDYVIAHELAHIRIPGHGADYWRLLRRAIPECQRLKVELDEMGRRVWLGDGSPSPPWSPGSSPSSAIAPGF